jgi:hypothetical protein
LNDDDRAQKRKKKTIEGNTSGRGQNTEQHSMMECVRKEEKKQQEDKNDYQYATKRKFFSIKVECLQCL